MIVICIGPLLIKPDKEHIVFLSPGGLFLYMNDIYEHEIWNIKTYTDFICLNQQYTDINS